MHMNQNNRNETTNNNASQIFNTMNRKLEQVLYNHGIMFTRQYKNVDGMNVWSYKRTPELDKIVNQFRLSRSCRPGVMKLAYSNPNTKE